MADIYTVDAAIPEFAGGPSDPGGFYLCSRGVQNIHLTCAEVQSIYDPSDVTPENIAFVFAWGFGAVLAFWALAYGLASIQRALRG